MIEHRTFAQVQVEAIRAALGGFSNDDSDYCWNHVIRDIDPASPIVTPFFNPEYAEIFKVFTVTGDHALRDELLEKYPHTKQYMQEHNGRNTLYGPRVQKQWQNLIDEAKANKCSRRLSISVLEADDTHLLESKRYDLVQAEFPCTFGFKFEYMATIDGVPTYVFTAIMRSSNVVTVLPYDFAVWQHIVKMFEEATGYKVDFIDAFLMNAHVYFRENPKALAILAAAQ